MTLQRYREWGAPAYVIAEAGVNHEGKLDVALEMVRAAVAAGVDAIKFQTYKAERLATKASNAYWDQTKEPADSQYELFRRYDSFGVDEYRRIASECAAHSLTFLTTAFDVESVDWIDALVPMFKVASADLTNVVLLDRMAQAGKPMLLSTGAATIDEIAEAVEFVLERGCPEVALLHCTLSYPTSREDANVGAVAHLVRAFPDAVHGYSDHTVPHDSFPAIAAAYVLGGRVIEKHFTLDKSLPGNDHYHAFDPEDFVRLRRELDAVRTLLGEDRVQVLEAETAARLHARRSLVSRGSIAAGTPITAAMLDVKRPGTGIEPRELNRVIGMRAVGDIEDDTTLQWEMLTNGAGSS
jgi:N-acetylneuraminate synthase